MVKFALDLYVEAIPQSISLIDWGITSTYNSSKIDPVFSGPHISKKSK
jgi:hypothetical protein